MQPVEPENMSNKRKSRDDDDEMSMDEEEPKVGWQRRRRRSRSEPRNTGSDGGQKRDALRRLFGRFCSSDDRGMFTDEDFLNDIENNPFGYVEDPLLLDSVPEDMDPEQLGFLLCAQETLRYLRAHGMSFKHPVYISLRRRFLKAMKELGIA